MGFNSNGDIWQELIQMKNINSKCSVGASDFEVIKVGRKVNNMRGNWVSRPVIKIRKLGKRKVKGIFNEYYKLF